MQKTVIPSNLAMATSARALRRLCSVSTDISSSLRQIHSTRSSRATALPITAAGPPPSAPLPASQYGDRIERRRRQADMLKQGRELRAGVGGKPNPLKKRFWKEVHVTEGTNCYNVLLDSRPVRTPSKALLSIPLSKPHLAHAIALEWDQLVSAQQALKNHNIPMTSLAARVQDIIEQEAQGSTKIRDDIVKSLMRYLDTDTLICWAPEQDAALAPQYEQHEQRTESLRSIQMRSAQPIIGYLTSRVWPGVEIIPVLDEESIVPRKQPESTRSIIRGWISGLPAHELAALERGVLACKSLLVATRLLIEWSEEFRALQHGSSEKPFGIEEAAEAASLEVRWQTGMWGEVEDTHDVDREDLKRQLGSVVLLVGGSRDH